MIYLVLEARTNDRKWVSTNLCDKEWVIMNEVNQVCPHTKMQCLMALLFVWGKLVLKARFFHNVPNFPAYSEFLSSRPVACQQMRNLHWDPFKVYINWLKELARWRSSPSETTACTCREDLCCHCNEGVWNHILHGNRYVELTRDVPV